jgi:hypothetical protein
MKLEQALTQTACFNIPLPVTSLRMVPRLRCVVAAHDRHPYNKQMTCMCMLTEVKAENSIQCVPLVRYKARNERLQG